MLLVTERMKLREMTEEDYEEVAAIMGDERVTYAWEHAFSAEETRAWIARRISQYRTDGVSYLLAEDRATGRVWGQAGLLAEDVGDGRVLGVGWIFRQDAWHRGYATEAGRALVDYAFRELAAPRVIADIRPNNLPSRAVAERLGMRVVGRFDKVVGGVVMPHLIYEIKRPAR